MKFLFANEPNAGKLKESVHFARDAFSHGQVRSKLWIVDELCGFLKSGQVKHQCIHIYGGWYGVLALLLKSRPEFRESYIRSFDLCEDSCRKADTLNESFIAVKREFESVVADVNDLKDYYLDGVDIVINTSCEHMADLSWYSKLPSRQMVALQSTDMPHWQHVNTVISIEEFKDKYPMRTCLFSGELKFEYENFSFTRFMIIGLKL